MAQKHYNGPWVFVDRARVPGMVVKLPPDVRHVRSRHVKMRYDHVEVNWKEWEKAKHWDKKAEKGGHGDYGKEGKYEGKEKGKGMGKGKGKE